MKLLLKFLIVIILFSINTPSILGQYKDANYIAYSQLGNVSLHNFDNLNRSKNEDETYLKNLFYPDTISKAGIKVLENALGDLTKDSVINIKDLLRLRDLNIGNRGII